MNKCFGWDVEKSQNRAEREAEKCLKEAMEETGLPKTAFTVSINPDCDSFPTWHWSVELASEK